MLKPCVICGTEFDATRTVITCSLPCKKERRRRWSQQHEIEHRERRRAQERARYHADPEKTRERNRRKRLANPESYRATAKRWRQKHPEKAREVERRWVNENREKARAKWRRSGRMNAEKRRVRELTRYYANPKRRLETNKVWQRANPDKIRTYRRNIRARRNAAPGAHTAADVRAILLAQRQRCAYCRTKLQKANTHIDHIVALSRGGTNDPRNLQALCASCNIRKHNKDPIDFAQAKGLLL